MDTHIKIQTENDRLNQITCLKILLENSGLNKPIWADLHNFVKNQLEVLETAYLTSVLFEECASLQISIEKSSKNRKGSSERQNSLESNESKIALELEWMLKKSDGNSIAPSSSTQRQSPGTPDLTVSTFYVPEDHIFPSQPALRPGG
ncbi:unnamed protein product [Brachionus calyciflorus]|uniref:Uncharacterized protein n=1 Tax=Brachionus calyciflorus TaxID=104777 RepID=A0A814IUP0_9BILA|nr:unnamed protein product [Brachionus calyciflorus]